MRYIRGATTAKMSLSLMLVIGLSLAADSAETNAGGGFFCLVGIGVILTAVCALGEAGQQRKVVAGLQVDAEGKPGCYSLTFGNETVKLEPGKTWVKVDAYKWVTRGLVDPPQSFHVQADGSVDINGEKIGIHAADGIAKLEYEINKRHVVAESELQPKTASAARLASAATPIQRPDKVQFKVRLDLLGHLMIECTRGTERVDTSLRGFNMLIQNGLLIKPLSFYVDPLQRAVEIEGERFECSEAGGQHLQDVLNARYAPSLKGEEENAIEIKENPASATGFDIRFVTVHLGARFEVKGHLAQERLDILQDPAKCDLLQPGIVLRLSPPNLLIRRRQPDGGEVKLPELPDLQYRRATVAQLQHVFNHPLVRRRSGEAEASSVVIVQEKPDAIIEMRVVKNPQNKILLWLECVSSKGTQPEGKAFTHHNLADLQHHGVFLPDLDVGLSFDNRRLGILDKQTHQEQVMVVDWSSPDDELAQAGRMLTAALKSAGSPMPLAPIEPNAPTAVVWPES
ncbi:MAG: hypothetical protein M1608_14545 [Candidatus Omnitrophica bacterium]|nr:hypothetical protein [Candidatus Omnitrophota bacterium]